MDAVNFALSEKKKKKKTIWAGRNTWTVGWMRKKKLSDADKVLDEYCLCMYSRNPLQD